MSECERIQWHRAQYWDDDCTFNPYVGCSPDVWTSPACANCYAHEISDRFAMTDNFKPTPKPKAVMPKKGICFCGNMTDLFGTWVTHTEWIAWFNMMWRFSIKTMRFEHNPAAYLWLTKRASRLKEAMDDPNVAKFAGGSYFGITAENDEWYEKRMEYIADLAMRKHTLGFKLWLSVEPMLGDVNIGEDAPFDWVVVGCESGSKRRPCPIERVEKVVAQCLDQNIPVFVKQLDINGVCERDINKFPEALRIRQMPFASCAKKAVAK